MQFPQNQPRTDANITADAQLYAADVLQGAANLISGRIWVQCGAALND